MGPGLPVCSWEAASQLRKLPTVRVSPKGAHEPPKELTSLENTEEGLKEAPSDTQGLANTTTEQYHRHRNPSSRLRIRHRQPDQPPTVPRLPQPY